jgi:hypothetical protein
MVCFDKFHKYLMKILLEDLNAKIGSQKYDVPTSQHP